MAIYTPRHYAVKVIKMTSDVPALKKAVKAGHFCCKGYMRSISEFPPKFCNRNFNLFSVRGNT
jgi:hypothetical protein